MSKKKLFSLAVIVIMIAILSFSTLAWFTDTDSATNDFNIGGAGTGDPEDIFDVEVKENVDGEEEPVDEMKFEDILPGDSYKKEAYVSNTGSYEQYIRVTMTITDWKLIQNIVTINMDDAFGTTWKISSTGVDVDDQGNLIASNDSSVNANGELVVILFLDKKLAVGDTVHIMDSVSISTKATQNDFIDEGFADGFQIKIEADAAQTENILDTYGDVEWQNAENTFKALDAEQVAP